jgi:hypothetical protein
VNLLDALRPVLEADTGQSSAGFPFLSEAGFDAFVRRVPHILGMGDQVLRALDQAASQGVGSAPARAVVATVVRTAAITAPSDLWLLKYVIPSFSADPASVDPKEREADMQLLEVRGYVERVPDEPGGWRIVDTARARRVLAELTPPPKGLAAGVSIVWARLFRGSPLSTAERAALRTVIDGGPGPARSLDQSDVAGRPELGWTATLEEIELGWRVLPMVLGLRLAGLTQTLADGKRAQPPGDSGLVEAAADHLFAAGLLRSGQPWEATRVGRRVFERGPGPFGIIEAYHAYMDRLGDILTDGGASVWVNRSANVAASQVANRREFGRANDLLDKFCSETGFVIETFIEHAMGRAEGIRQRWGRSGDDAGITYVGADLEDAAVEAAALERHAGRLPPGVHLFRGCDIGRPESLLSKLRSEGISTQGAVMMVGNGFHEVRGVDDGGMVDVFRGYHDAGIVLVFTEASALSGEDLLRTAWNTYHAGFRYVHAKSGQGLRPADAVPGAPGRRRLPSSWQTCAEAAGYVREERWCGRSRTIYPTTPSDRPNPSISVTHFCVPRPLHERLLRRAG